MRIWRRKLWAILLKKPHEKILKTKKVRLKRKSGIFSRCSLNRILEESDFTFSWLLTSFSLISLTNFKSSQLFNYLELGVDVQTGQGSGFIFLLFGIRWTLWSFDHCEHRGIATPPVKQSCLCILISESSVRVNLVGICGMDFLFWVFINNIVILRSLSTSRDRSANREVKISHLTWYYIITLLSGSSEG